MIPGKPEFVAPGVRRIVAGNAGLMTGPGTNTYLLGDREVAGARSRTRSSGTSAQHPGRCRAPRPLDSRDPYAPRSFASRVRARACDGGAPDRFAASRGRAAGREFSPRALAPRRRTDAVRRDRTDGDSYAGSRLQLRVLPLGKRAAAVHRRSCARRRLTGHPGARRRYGAVPALSRQARCLRFRAHCAGSRRAHRSGQKSRTNCCALTGSRARRRCCTVSSGAPRPAPHRRSMG